MRFVGHYRGVLLGCLGLVVAQSLLPARADAGDEPADATCAARVEEARFDLEELREQERLAPVDLAANQAVLDLLEPLWEARSTERLRYLEGKHDRDVSRLQVSRSRIASERAAALLAVLERECFADDGRSEAEGAGDPEDRESEVAARMEEYARLGCLLVAKNREIASVDLAYAKEVHEAISQLRSRELATEQRLILTRYDVERAKAELRTRTARLAECRAETAARPPEGPG